MLTGSTAITNGVGTDNDCVEYITFDEPWPNTRNGDSKKDNG